jgi:hypothetical protein
MSRTFLFLTLLLVSSFCIEKKADNVNQIIDELVELNKSVQTPADQLGNLVSQIRSSAHQSAKAFGVFYAGVQANCKAGTRYLAAFTAKLNGDLTGTQQGVVHCQNVMRRGTAAGVKLSVQVTAARKSLKSSARRQTREAAVFRALLAEAKGKLLVLKQVRDIVVDELLNGKAPASLIQVNTITSKLLNLKAMVAKDNDSMFSAVVGSLLEMVTEQNLNDQTILRKFLAALARLGAKITAYVTKSTASAARIRALNTATNAAKLRSLRALGKLLVEARSSVVAGRNMMAELNNAKLVLTRAVNRKTRETKQWSGLCGDQARVAALFVGAHKALRAKTQQVSAGILNSLK